MTTPAVEIPLCLCGCGQPIRSKGAKWRRGHFHYGVGGWPGPDLLPGPGDPVDLDQTLAMRTANGARELADEIRGSDGAELGGPGAELPGMDADPPPAPLRPDAPGRAGSSGGALKVTATVRREIKATISLPLEVLGQIWAVRDPFCGGRFLDTRQTQADAYTDVICQSQQWVDFFTGPAGGFMAYVKVGAAVWPTIEMIIAHHVTHSVGGPRDQAPGPAPAPSPDDLMARYPA